MKITQSAVAMASEREASRTYDLSITATGDRFWVNGTTSQASKEKEAAAFLGWSSQPASLELSEEAKTKEASEKTKDGSYRKKDKNKPFPEKEGQKTGFIDELTGQTKKQPDWETEESFKLKMMRQLFESLRSVKGNKRPNYMGWGKKTQQAFGFSMQSWQRTAASMEATSIKASAGSRVTTAKVGAGHWEERVTMSKIFTDREVTSFSTMGTVETADGRSINFNLNLEMSREFTQAVGVEYSRKTFCIDPLVINLEGNPASFSDQTFFFDLDSDGKVEELSSLAAGSGFLALDLNNDGVINDGSELFGTKSGDGFKDLAAYDKDGNGWIDENDEVFKHLKVWTKDADGSDRLIAIADAGVGAIYLGHTATEFSLNTLDTNQTQGIVRSTGVFLKESGGVGTIQHVDLVV